MTFYETDSITYGSNWSKSPRFDFILYFKLAKFCKCTLIAICFISPTFCNDVRRSKAFSMSVFFALSWLHERGSMQSPAEQRHTFAMQTQNTCFLYLWAYNRSVGEIYITHFYRGERGHFKKKKKKGNLTKTRKNNIKLRYNMDWE